MRKPAVFIALALLGAAAGALSYRHFAQPKVERATTIAPALSFATLDGKTLALSSLRGRWVLINFWASWCAPCMDELPHLVAAQSNYGSLGLQIIGPALDEPAAVQPLLRRFQINYPVAANFSAGDAAMRELGNDRGALPFSVLIDPDGFVAERVLGGMSAEQLQQLLQRHLGRS